MTVALAKLIAKLPSATVADCQADYRTPAQRDDAAAKVRENRGQTIADAQAASTWHGRRNK